MNADTPTSFGDANRRLDLRSMRELQREAWEGRDRRIFRSLLERDATRLPEPPPSEEPESELDRRDFMKMMGGGLALAGLAACTRQPTEKIVPYVKAPEEIIPGKPLFFATSILFGGFAQGALVESHMGRPTKVEGNPGHPASLGGTDAFAQASVLDLYDPDRSQGIRRHGVASDFGSFRRELAVALDAVSGTAGDGLRIVLPANGSPTEQRLLDKILAAYPEAKIHRHSPVGHDNPLLGAELAFGKPMQAVPRLDQADVIVSLDADFLGWSPARARFSADFASRRRVSDGAKSNRLYVFEASYTQTGGVADHRLPVRSGRIEGVARALAAALGAGGSAPELTEAEQKVVDAVVVDLNAVRGKGLVLVGANQPPVVHAIAHAINARLGALGTTIEMIEPVLSGPAAAAADFKGLVADMRAGKVKALFLLDVNPVYSAPGDLRFAAALASVPLCVHLGTYNDETGTRVQWHLPGTHGLETWSDATAYDGTLCIAQPLIAPLYKGHSALEILSLIAGEAKTSFELVRETWQARTGLENDEDGFNRFWRTALHDGFVAGTASQPWKGLRVREGVLGEGTWKDPVADFGLEVVFRPDPRVWDGQFANNAWLQEMPCPVSTLTWDTVFTMSPATARRYKVLLTKDGVQSREKTRPQVQIIELTLGSRSVHGPVLVLPGHADDSVTVTFGGGREDGRVAKGVGYSAYRLQGSDAAWIAQGATLLQLNRWMDLALTQDHFALMDDGRKIIRDASLAQYKAAPDFATQMGHKFDDKYTLYPKWDYSKGNQWGMVIDLNTCIGCNACVIACQAENNIPTVGKKQVMNGREMHWIRVDRYFEETANGETRLHTMPMACVHCENAPCETVCPVGATMHSNDGLNMMVYNRCVGTRYCSNNCPYKVRRFNFFKYTDDKTESLKFQRNPDVTVRLRGVMEKCTYCVQRINLGRIDAKVARKPIQDGDILTACQQACPTRAITFGDINDPHSQVAKLKGHSLNYTILEPLNTRARTSYLAKVRNPSHALEPQAGQALVFHHGPHAPDAAHGSGGAAGHGSAH